MALTTILRHSHGYRSANHHATFWVKLRSIGVSAWVELNAVVINWLDSNWADWHTNFGAFLFVVFQTEAALDGAHEVL